MYHGLKVLQSLARLAGPAGLLSCLVLLGYIAGMALVFLRDSAGAAYQHAAHLASSSGESIPPLPPFLKMTLLGMKPEEVSYSLTPFSRYPNLIASGLFREYPPWDDIIGFSIATLIAIAVVVVAGFLLSHSARLGYSSKLPLRSDCNYVLARRAWHEALARPPCHRRLMWAAGAAVGFSAGVLGQSISIAINNFWGDAGGAFQKPIFALLAWPDAIYLLGGTLVLTVIGLVKSGRVEMVTRAHTHLLCLACAQPTILHQGAATNERICAECGPKPWRNARKTPQQWVWVSITLLVFLTTVAYFAAPLLSRS